MDYLFKLASPLIISVPILLTGLSASDAGHELRTIAKIGSSQPSCGCSMEQSVVKAQERDATSANTRKQRPTQFKVAIQRCVPVPEDQACFLTGDVILNYFCEAGGVWRTCEGNAEDNDGDGIESEAHFYNYRQIRKYACPTTSFWACGGWNVVTASNGHAACCSTYETAPPCPGGTCSQ